MGLTKASYAMINGAPLNILDFGAVGDGSTDNTAAFQAAITTMQQNGRDVFIPPGIYMTDALDFGAPIYSKQGTFFGNDSNRCIIRRRTAGSGAFITVGSASSTYFQANLDMRDLTIDGGVTTNGPAFQGYDIVNSLFSSVIFKGGSEACNLYGGVQLTFRDCQFREAVNGFRARSFTSAAGGGYPNLITISGGAAVFNSGFGISFNGGQQLTLEYVDVESNGTTIGSDVNGGVHIGTLIGQSVTVNEPLVIGAIIRECWIENNQGLAQVSCLSGLNIVSNCNFFCSSAFVTHDMYFANGKYEVSNCTVGFPKTYNLYENSDCLAGNSISYSEIPTLNYNGAKTTVYYDNKIVLRGASVPSVPNVGRPMYQQGLENSGGSTGVVTFPTPFGTGTFPRVFAAPKDLNSASTIEQVDVYSVSNTGFAFRKKVYDGSSITTGTYDISWVAFGRYDLT